MRMLKSRPLLILLPLLLLGIAIVISQRPQLIDSPTPTISITATSTTSPTPIPPTHRELWNTRGGLNYEMIVEDIRMPQPPVAQALTIQDGKVVKNSIIACDNPSDEYPARLCEPVRTYYSTLGIYTVEELFGTADACLSKTRELMSQCSALSATPFQDFPDTTVMFESIKMCSADFQNIEEGFCAVKYDPYYGYPREISIYYPDFTDGFSSITVKGFRLTE
jgi:hypothetical protein